MRDTGAATGERRITESSRSAGESERSLVTLYRENPVGPELSFPSIARLLFIYLYIYVSKQKDGMRTGMKVLRSHHADTEDPYEFKRSETR